MDESGHGVHFGLNCRHLRRDDHAPADGRCALAIVRYAAPEYAFLDARTPVPLTTAARLLGVPESEVVRRAKEGECEFFFPENVARRIRISTKAGSRLVTISEAAKRLGKTAAELEQQVTAGEIKAEYPDEFLHIVLTTRWDFEKCPLLSSGGACFHFEPHDKAKICHIGEANVRGGSNNAEGENALFPGLDLNRGH